MAKYDYNYVPFRVADVNQGSPPPFLTALSATYRAQLAEYANVNVFNLNETESVEFCNSSRTSIDAYMSCLGRFNFNKLTDEHLVAADFGVDDELASGAMTLIGHFSNQPLHIPPLTLNLLTNALFKVP